MPGDPLDSELQPTAVITEATNGVEPHDDVTPQPVGDPVMAAATTDADTQSEASGEALSDDESSPDFLGRLAQAMRKTVDDERSRVGVDIERQHAEQLAAIQTRRDAEAARMRELAADDRRGIETWAEGERTRIRAERDRRLAAVEADLVASLDEHGQSVEAQIAELASRITTHRTEVEAFFESLESETDPVRIAQLAAQRPTFPDLSGPVPASAPSSAAADTSPAPADASEPAPAHADMPDSDVLIGVPAAADERAAESAGVAVMDPIARLGLLNPDPVPPVDTWRPAQEPAGAWRPGSADASPNAADDLYERVAAPAGSSGGVIGWIRRKDHTDH